tara:strand:+ start:134 stop:1399 length:1266 start_codon:yes stop_codon:yes gene_type:complete
MAGIFLPGSSKGGDITAVTAGDGLSGGGDSGDLTVTLDLNELTAATVAVASDSIAIIDADDDGSKKESVADFVSGIAGTNISAGSGVLSVADSAVGTKGIAIVAGTSPVSVAYSSGTATISVTFGISNTNAVKVDSASVADDEYARFTASGLESRSTSEVLSDISAAPAAGDGNILTTGALDSGSISSNFGAIDNGTSNIRTATFTAETAVVPDAASGATLGTTSLEWGHIYVGDDQKLYLGDAQDVSLEYDEDGTDQLRIAGGTIFEDQVQLDKDLLLDSTPADTVWSGITAQFTAGEDLEDGECVYFKAGDSKMWKAVANTGGTGLVTAEIMCVAMCVSDVSADAVGTFLLQGFLHAATNFPTYAIGETLYLPEAEVGGKNVPEGEAPDTDGDFVQVIGWAAGADTVYFSPNFTMVEVA